MCSQKLVNNTLRKRTASVIVIIFYTLIVTTQAAISNRGKYLTGLVINF